MKGLPFVFISILIFIPFYYEDKFEFIGMPSPLLTGFLATIPFLLFILLKQEIEKNNLAYSFILLTVYMFGNIFIFAGIYAENGILDSNQVLVYSDFHSFFFSLATWTTLSYGNYTLPESIVMYSSVEALMGYMYLGVLIGFVSNWLFSKSRITVK